ncbi:MAG: hypothetical protein IJS93_01720 [Clostridia bacterium]|nr:hypothetical protein [Clostridia bacterium]
MKKVDFAKITKELDIIAEDFNDLSERDREMFLSYIRLNHNIFRYYGKKGYDLFNNVFFVYEYNCGDSFRWKLSINEFKDFEEYFYYVGEEIYDNACYLGYVFSYDEITKFKLDIGILERRKSFLNYDISSYSFDRYLKQIRIEENFLKARNNCLKREIGRCENFSSFQSLMNDKDYSFGLSKKIILRLIIQNNPIIANKIIEDGIRTLYYFFDYTDFSFLVNFYGKDIAQNYINNYCERYLFIEKKPVLNKRIRIMKRLLDIFTQQAELKVCGFYDDKNNLYIKKIYTFVDGDLYSIPYYYLDFTTFIDAVDNDLSDCDISTSLETGIDYHKYKTNVNTKLPKDKKYDQYSIQKKYYNGSFYVTQSWYDNHNKVLTYENDFQLMCDFLFFLQNDLSNADFLFCEDLSWIKKLNNIKVDNIKVRSEIAKKIQYPFKCLEQRQMACLEYALTEEKSSYEVFLNKRRVDCDYNGVVSYITDIHLMHKFNIWNCITENDEEYVIERMVQELSIDKSDIKLIGGDISSDYSIYKKFLRSLGQNTIKGSVFITLGNHELWPFSYVNDGENETYKISVNDIVSTYRQSIEENGFHLIHNSLYYWECPPFYYGSSAIEIKEDELSVIDEIELRNKLRKAVLVIFGGIGFSGYNDVFNAQQGIYRYTLDRAEEINESIKFEKLYKKVEKALFDKNVIIFTHMPIKDWLKDEKINEGFVYVNGHNHRNYYYDDGKKRVYADNQIGYKTKNISYKNFSIHMDYDWFSDYKDGIYEIDRNDYLNYYRGINEIISFNRKFDQLYIVKRNGSYMFLMKANRGKLYILNGGSIRKASVNDLNYYYNLLPNYVDAIKLYLAEYYETQKKYAEFVKEFGGQGTIHGCIIDIDFYNHIYMNPIDGKIIPYYAYDIIDKVVFKDIKSLLKNKCPSLYVSYKKCVSSTNKEQLLRMEGKDNKNDTETKEYYDTDIYRISRIIKSLQFTLRYSLVRVWDDEIAFCEPTKEIGKRLLIDYLYPKKAN